MYEALLMQADFLSAAEGLVVAIATLLSAASGIIVYIINAKKSINKGELSARDEQILEAAKAALLGGQKTVENIGEIRQVAQAIYDILGPEQRRQLEEKVAPILRDTTTRIDVGNQQIAHMRSVLTSLIGPDADVDKDTRIVREPKQMSERLRSTPL
ncbi:MAG: hypothetical protein M3297_02230 [Thermoproteota archaeon]|jgi:3-oxoacyl-ACP reductase-like protein|nr:hypothetical protein [Thermoproteota archaeon]